VEELRKKNEGLLATNKFLLEENASIRNKSASGGRLMAKLPRFYKRETFSL